MFVNYFLWLHQDWNLPRALGRQKLLGQPWSYHSESLIECSEKVNTSGTLFLLVVCLSFDPPQPSSGLERLVKHLVLKDFIQFWRHSLSTAKAVHVHFRGPASSLFLWSPWTTYTFPPPTQQWLKCYRCWTPGYEHLLKVFHKNLRKQVLNSENVVQGHLIGGLPCAIITPKCSRKSNQTQQYSVYVVTGANVL